FSTLVLGKSAGRMAIDNYRLESKVQDSFDETTAVETMSEVLKKMQVHVPFAAYIAQQPAHIRAGNHRSARYRPCNEAVGQLDVIKKSDAPELRQPVSKKIESVIRTFHVR